MAPKKRKRLSYQSYDSFSDSEEEAKPLPTTEHHLHTDFVSSSHRPKHSIVETIAFEPASGAKAAGFPPASEWDDVEDFLHNDFDENTLGDASYYQFWIDPTFVQHPDCLEDLSPKGRGVRPSDHPLRAWLPDRDLYLRELLRLEGRGNYKSQMCSCKVNTAGFRCVSCFDSVMWCSKCIILRHKTMPFHRIEEWAKYFYRNVSLSSLGLRMSLGHSAYEDCVCARSCDKFVVLSTDGIHVVNIDFCGCERAEPRTIQLLRARLFPATSTAPQTAATFEVLRLFQILTFMSKCSAYEFYQTLARLTENTGTSHPPDRYKAFLCMMRQWRHLKLMKRFGRGHSSSGISGTREGECAVLCPACPQPGINLPKDFYSQADPWKYALFLAFDGNFRLKRLDVSNEETDPGLNEGYSFCVQNKPFQEFLARYQNLITEDPSTCNDHKAIKHAQTRGSIRMGATGLGTIDCSRHDMKRPCSLGDFQKGERQINIDYCLLTSLRSQIVTHLVLSYDVICQWGVKLGTRLAKYNVDYPNLTRPFSKLLSTRFLVPKYHLRAHRDYCKARFDFHLTPGVGMTDGEGPERGWAAANGLANSTKEMGPGHRRDVLDDFFGDYNWRKTATIAVSLRRKLDEAIPAAARYEKEFNDLTATLPSELVKSWETQVVGWEQDPNGKGVVNPYDATVRPVTIAKVRKELAEEDRNKKESETLDIVPEVTPFGMIMQGIEIEELQYRQQRDRKRLSQSATPLQQSKVVESGTRLQRKIDSWTQIQQFYLPGALLARQRSPPPEDPSELPLFLPSACHSYGMRVSATMLQIEFRLRIAEANDALASIRSSLLTRDRMWKFKDTYIRGQRDSGRANATITSVNERITAAAIRYRKAREALSILSKPLVEHDWKRTLLPLAEADVKGLKWKSNYLDEVEESESRRSLPWIWKTEGVIVGDDPETDPNVNEALRIEWCRTRARSLRWKEECVLLAEECRRVKDFFAYQRNWWLARRDAQWCLNAELREGLTAYATRQAWIRQAMLDGCEDSFRESKDSAAAMPQSLSL